MTGKGCQLVTRLSSNSNVYIVVFLLLERVFLSKEAVPMGCTRHKVTDW